MIILFRMKLQNRRIRNFSEGRRTSFRCGMRVMFQNQEFKNSSKRISFCVCGVCVFLFQQSQKFKYTLKRTLNQSASGQNDIIFKY